MFTAIQHVNKAGLTLHRCHTKRIILVFLFILTVINVQTSKADLYHQGGDEEERKIVLVFGAANTWVNWTHVESFSSRKWEVVFVDLAGFGDIMQTEGFQAALDENKPKLARAIKLLKPSVLLVKSKGLGILTSLVVDELWKGPSVLISPIPNMCEHVVKYSSYSEADNDDFEIEASWELEWAGSINILIRHNVGPISIGVGSTSDEQTLIVDIIEESKLCGNINFSNRTTAEKWSGNHRVFEHCKLWNLHTFPGNHGWASEVANAPNIAYLIDEVIQKNT